jgi:hypothetical protein
MPCWPSAVLKVFVSLVAPERLANGSSFSPVMQFFGFFLGAALLGAVLFLGLFFGMGYRHRLIIVPLMPLILSSLVILSLVRTSLLLKCLCNEAQVVVFIRSRGDQYGPLMSYMDQLNAAYSPRGICWRFHMGGSGPRRASPSDLFVRHSAANCLLMFLCEKLEIQIAPRAQVPIDPSALEPSYGYSGPHASASNPPPAYPAMPPAPAFGTDIPPVGGSGETQSLLPKP